MQNFTIDYYARCTVFEGLCLATSGLVCRICVCALEEYNYYYNYVFFSKLKQLKEVLYDGLEKMPRKDGKTGHLIIYMLIVKPNITYLHSYNYNTHGH